MGVLNHVFVCFCHYWTRLEKETYRMHINIEYSGCGNQKGLPSQIITLATYMFVPTYRFAQPILLLFRRAHFR